MFLIKATLFITTAIIGVWSFHVNTEDVGILSGKQVSIKEAPFVVSIRVKSHIQCAGSIIDKKFVLTSAHCVPQQADEYTIHAETNKRNDIGTVYRVAQVIKHEKFNPSVSRDYDIALLRLTTPINTNTPYAKTIRLPAKTELLNDRSYLKLDIYGWGETESKPASDYLMKVSVPLSPNAECRKTYDVITARMLCTGIRYNGFCTGDSGGPAIYRNVQYGIIAYADSPCTMYPQVYTYLPPLRDWIDEKLEEYK